MADQAPDAFDWDDSALIKAYNKGMQLRDKAIAKAAKKAKQAKRDTKSADGVTKAEKKKDWKLGDHCRAKFAEDNLYYEAKIVDFEGEYASVVFVGFGNEDVCKISDLKKSAGKAVRKQQEKKAWEECDQYSEMGSAASGEVYGAVSETHSSSTYRMHHGTKVPNHSAHEHGHNHSAFEHMATGTPHCHPPPVPYFAPQHPPQMAMPPPPPPPMPCTGMPQNSSLSNMMSAWYMAGYYTGFQMAQSSCPQSNCNHMSCGHH